MRIQDDNYYPYRFKSWKVTSQDVNGNPTETVFYSDKQKNKPVFKWIQEWNAFDKCVDWKIEYLKND